jgi:hypothetical protein
MMSPIRRQLQGAVYPSEIELLQRIFDERHIDPHSVAAEDLADYIIALFQRGITDEDEIRGAGGPKKNPADAGLAFLLFDHEGFS